ncbi:MAG: RdgB/HAM1 family non-canonical purine NTP pyrophosphatase [Erysipelotrichales bacterium]|nr:RdgB/HAM1 family non-canonical purine NTP pyrophosphatase [Erysipelotrichales bacterium]
MRLVIATTNEHKLIEMRQLLKDLPFEVVGQNEIVDNIDIDENGTTFSENARIKATAISALCSDLVLADDSGLEIDALNKEPGIYSARYLGHDTPYSEKNQIILKRLENESNRSARFVCAMSLCLNGEEVYNACETIEGEIAHEVLGTNGFGYDPIFYYPPMQMGTAEMDMDTKNQVSHRGKAIRKIIAHLREKYVEA